MSAIGSATEVEGAWRSIMAAIPDYVMLFTASGQMIWTNHLAPQLSDDYLAQRPVFDVLDPEHALRLKLGFERVLATGSTEELDISWVHPKTGQRHWFASMLTPLPHGPSPDLIAIVARDITDRRRLEHALQTAEEQFRIHFQSHPLPSFVWRYDNGELHFHDYNKAAVAFTNGRVGEILGIRETELFASQPLVIEDMQRCAQKHVGSQRDIDHRMATTGELKRLRICLAFVPPHFVVVYAEDLTEQHRTIQALRESEERARSYFEAAIDPLWDLDIATGRVISGPGQARLMGYDPDHFDLDLAQYQQHVHPEDLPGLLKAYGACLDGSRPYYESIHRLRTRQGEWRWVMARAVIARRDADGRPLRMVGYDRDITEHRAAEERARLQLCELAHLARLSSLGEMAAGIAHELNQPLSAIVNFAEAALRRIGAGDHSEETLRRDLGEIIHMGRRAGDVIRRIRGLVSRRFAPPTLLDLNDLIRETLALIESEARGAGVSLVMQLAPQLPRVSADAVQMQQVLINLLRNAIEAMADVNDRERVLTARSVVAGQSVRVSVADTGPGVSEEVAQRLFDPFFTTKTQGMGIGLSLARSIMEAHGGRIAVDRNSTMGLEIWFTLPVVGPDATQSS